jgi:hypothetical protein
MGVEVSMRDESGAPVEWFPTSDAVAWLLWAADQAGNCRVVTRIDEYGSVTLLHDDIPLLVEEAQRAALKLPNDARRRNVEDLVVFLRRARDMQVAQLHFQGD